MDEPVSFVHIINLNDDLLLPWLDLYETAFPPNERILVSSILKEIRDNHSDETREINIMAILDKEDLYIGMAMYQLPVDKPVGVLWYVAILPSQRSKGWGSKVYEGILSHINPEIHKALVFEVEIPGEANSSPDAERRIRFYQRNGAKLLTGIHYIRSVGWHQPPTPMHLMIHPLQPMNAETAFKLTYSLFGDALQKTGSLVLE